MSSSWNVRENIFTLRFLDVYPDYGLNLPVLAQCSISIPPENVRKPLVL